VRVLVAMLAPYKGRVYDPCCGSGGMFVQSEKFIDAHSGRIGDIWIYGQESNYTTWRLAKMNLAIRGIYAQIAHGDSFHNDQHPDLKADYVLANPPFNDSDWRGELLRNDKRWAYGAPPAGNANFAWVQHFTHHLAPNGTAGFVLANGSMSSNQSGEGEIRKAIAEADLVDCMVALPGQLFYATQIPVCLWFLARDKKNGRFRDRCGATLFVDARKLGTMVDRVHRELTDADIAEITGTYHAWRGDRDACEYADVPGFCKSASLDDIRKHGHVLTPGRYVGAGAAEEDNEPFDEKMGRLVPHLLPTSFRPASSTPSWATFRRDGRCARSTRSLMLSTARPSVRPNSTPQGLDYPSSAYAICPPRTQAYGPQKRCPGRTKSGPGMLSLAWMVNFVLTSGAVLRAGLISECACLNLEGNIQQPLFAAAFLNCWPILKRLRLERLLFIWAKLTLTILWCWFHPQL
jgi:hypothetical protein